ncbi:MAG: hypothetical protein HGA19_00530, partial [Oscillochloris sp.]|nr:hypothetical protein [Oscillochloris sp.]
MSFPRNAKERFLIGDKELCLIPSDITTIVADVIVSSDDNLLTMGGGVSEAILSAGGINIWEESRQYVPAALGSVAVTSAGSLSAKYIFHAIVIDYDEWKWPDIEIIQQVTMHCLDEAEARSCRSIVMPAFGTGAGSLASETAAQAVVNTVFQELPKKTSLTTVILSLPRQDTLFDFLKHAIETRIRAEFEAKLTILEKDKERLIAELKAKSPYKDLPFPIAMARRTIEAHQSFHSKFTSTIDCLESIIRYCAAVTLADRMRLGVHETDEIHQLFLNKKLTLGSWVNILEENLQKLKGKDVFPATAKISQFYYSKNKGYISELLKVRNEVHGHGATLPEQSYSEIYTKHIEKIDRMIADLVFTEQFPIIIVHQADIQEDCFEYEVTRIVGDNIIFSRNSLRCNALRLSKHTPYIYSAEHERALALLPFLIFEVCPHCNVQETFFLETTGEKESTYHTH